MTRRSDTTRSRILEAAYELFYRQGFSGVGVDAVAAAAGVTKRTLYYHFDSKDTLIAAMLDRQHDLALERIARWARPEVRSPRQAVETLFAGMRDWAAAPGWRGSGFSRAAMELAGLPGHPARAAAARHKQAVEAAIGDVLAASGATDPALARRVAILAEGALTLALIHGDAAYFDEAASVAVGIVGAASL